MIRFIWDICVWCVPWKSCCLPFFDSIEQATVPEMHLQHTTWRNFQVGPLLVVLFCLCYGLWATKAGKRYKGEAKPSINARETFSWKPFLRARDQWGCSIPQRILKFDQTDGPSSRHIMLYYAIDVFEVVIFSLTVKRMQRNSSRTHCNLDSWVTWGDAAKKTNLFAQLYLWRNTMATSSWTDREKISGL